MFEKFNRGKKELPPREQEQTDAPTNPGRRKFLGQAIGITAATAMGSISEDAEAQNRWMVEGRRHHQNTLRTREAGETIANIPVTFEGFPVGDHEKALVENLITLALPHAKRIKFSYREDSRIHLGRRVGTREKMYNMYLHAILNDSTTVEYVGTFVYRDHPYYAQLEEIKNALLQGKAVQNLSDGSVVPYRVPK